MTSSSGGAFPARFLLISLALHGALAFVLWWGGPRWKQDQPLQIRMVRLAGGGQNKAGWVSDEMSPDASTPVVEPVAETAPPQQAEGKTTPKPVLQPSAPTVARRPGATNPPEKSPSREPGRRPAESEQALPPSSGQSRPRDTGAGPRGAGSSRTGAMADQSDTPGMNQYLTRVENAIQRAFKYPARSSKRKAVFHFIIHRDGVVEELELVQESGLPGLDLAGRSALTRAQLPPLPPAFGYDKIGVTFTFVDD